MKHPSFKIAVLGAMLLSSASTVRAQSFSVEWFVAAGGGGSCAGGEFSLDGTFGQSDATEQPLTGDVFSLTGGFWSLFASAEAASQVVTPANFVTLDRASADNLTTTLKTDSASQSAKVNVSPSLFAAAAGTYQGLFYSSNGVASQSAGFFDARVTGNGAFSARLQFASGVASFSGQFPPTGLFSNSIPVSSSAMTVQLRLDQTNSGMTGQISGSEWTAELLANRAAYSKTNPASQAGQYVLLISSGARSGESFGAATVDGSGRVIFSGTLEDGPAATATAMLTGTGQWPFFMPLDAGAGSVLGWLAFSNAPNSTVGGSLTWIAPSQPEPAGGTNIITVIGSHCQP